MFTAASQALVFGMIANGFAAIKGQENGKLTKDSPETYKRYGGVGNLFAMTEVRRDSDGGDGTVRHLEKRLFVSGYLNSPKNQKKLEPMR